MSRRGDAELRRRSALRGGGLRTAAVTRQHLEGQLFESTFPEPGAESEHIFQNLLEIYCVFFLACTKMAKLCFRAKIGVDTGEHEPQRDHETRTS